MSTAIDAMVATEVMKWKRLEDFPGWSMDGVNVCAIDDGDDVVWSPSTDIADAWGVVEKFTDVVIEKSGESWWVRISGVFEANTPDGSHEPIAATICRAALRAVGVPESQIEEAMR